MKIEQLKTYYIEFIDWTQSLKQLTDIQWHTPIGSEKWSIAAVITHLLFWDKYSLEERFPLFNEGAILSPYPNFEELNIRARDYAEKVATKEEILDELIETRKAYLSLLEGMTPEDLAISFQIDKHKMTVKEYLTGFIEHDLHHQKQIHNTLKS